MHVRVRVYVRSQEKGGAGYRVARVNWNTTGSVSRVKFVSAAHHEKSSTPVREDIDIS